MARVRRTTSASISSGGTRRRNTGATSLLDEQGLPHRDAGRDAGSLQLHAPPSSGPGAPLRLFSEAALDQGEERLDRRPFVGPVGHDLDLRALGGGQEQQARGSTCRPPSSSRHDDRDLRPKGARGVDEARGGPRVQAETVADGQAPPDQPGFFSRTSLAT